MRSPRGTQPNDVDPHVAQVRADRVGPTILDLRSPPPQEIRHVPGGHEARSASEAPGKGLPGREPGREPARLAGPEEMKPAPDRWTLLWRAKVWIALATVLAGAGAYAASSRITPSYQASSLVQVSAHPQTGISPQDIATASNELAAQLAQLTRTAPVVDLAAQ